MKFVLDKNFAREVKDISKEDIKKSVLYPWITLKGEEVELYNMEDWKIAPIVRFLVQWKKKANWLLFLIVGILLLLFFGVVVYAFYPKEEIKVIDTIPLISEPVIKTETKTEIKTDTETETEKQNNWNMELFNEVDTMRNLKSSAELETLQTKYELNRLRIELEEKTKINEKLVSTINNLKEDLKVLNTRKLESPEDNFVYYLWDVTYKRCENTADKTIIENCKTLYFKFLEYAKNR